VEKTVPAFISSSFAFRGLKKRFNLHEGGIGNYREKFVTGFLIALKQLCPTTNLSFSVNKNNTDSTSVG
jgi:hypothetical protein